MHLAGFSANERELLDHLAAEERVTVGADDVMALRGVSRPTANRILARLRTKGWLRRIKRGLYAPIALGAKSHEPAVEDAWVLAMRLFAPCYISGWSAAEHWDFTEQIFNAVALVTAKPQRSGTQSHADVTFRVRTVDRTKLFGTKKLWVGSHEVAIADPSRLLVDILDAPELGGGARHTVDVMRAYFRSTHADPDRLFDYAVEYGRGTVFKRLGFLAERFGSAPDAWLERCRAHMTKGISDLDPAGPKRGRIVTRWRLRVNIPLEAA